MIDFLISRWWSGRRFVFRLLGGGRFLSQLCEATEVWSDPHRVYGWPNISPVRMVNELLYGHLD